MTRLFNRMFRFVLCGLVLLGTLQAFAATTEVVDAIGRKVRITTPVQRVVLNFNFELLAPECSVSINFESKW